MAEADQSAASEPTPEPRAIGRARRPRRAPVPAASPELQIDNLPDLHEPFVLCAFEGWNDAAQSATGACRKRSQYHTLVVQAKVACGPQPSEASRSAVWRPADAVERKR